MILLERIRSVTPGRERRRGAMRVQSLLFPKETWTVARAKAWAKREGYRYGDVDEHGRYIHLRQFDPAHLTVVRTITLKGTDIQARVGR